MTREDGLDVEALLRVADELAIRNLLARYCRGIDRLDRQLVRSCYHDDATDKHGTFEGTVEEFLDWSFELLERFSRTMHFLGTTLVEFPDDRPDVAAAESYGVAVHVREGGRQQDNWTSGFRYVDRLERRPAGSGGRGDWKIAARVVAVEWTRSDPVDLELPITGDVTRGVRNRDDPVYHVLDR